MTSDLPRLSSRLFNGLALLTVAIPVVAWSTLLPVHTVRGKMDYLTVNSVEFYPVASETTASWKESTYSNFANLRAQNKAGDTYEFSLVSTKTSERGTLYGFWNVTKNGEPECTGCTGGIYVTDPNSGYPYLKGFVSTQSNYYQYTFGGNVTSRSDY